MPKHNIKDIDKIKASMRSIKIWGIGTHPDSAGQMAALSENGAYIILRDNVVYNMFIDKRGKGETERYYKRFTEGRLKKWAEQLRRYFTGLLIR